MLIKNGENKIIIWNDESTKETILLFPRELKANIQKKAAFMGNTFPVFIQEGLIEPVWSFMFLISSEEVNGQDCYKIIWSPDGATIWVNKENGIKVKSKNGYIIENGEKYDSITEWKNVKFNELTEEDMSRPNLMGYTVNENR